MSTVTFPVEILSNIVRQATLVPELLDTSPSIYFESRNAIVKDFRDSMKTKLSLCLVSKDFHHVMESYLYEVVMVFRFQYIPVLLQRLQSIVPRSTIHRGHRCQRLDLYLGVGGDVRYQDEAWYEGGHTLWGLIPACPNLKILVARVVSAKFFLPSLTHNALWKTIAACLAKTICRLELYGLQIRMDRVEMMLRYLTELEACSIVNVSGFDSLKHIYDEEEPKKRYFSRSCYRTVLIEDDWDYSRPSGYFNASTVSEFKAAKENSCWPPFNGSAPYTLAHLHTLRLDLFDSKRMKQFNFPRLCHLDMYSYSKTECLSRSRGSFPDSLSHLTYAGEGASIAQIIGFSPQLRHLTLSVEFSEIPCSHYTHTHLYLEVIELATWKSYFDPKPWIRDVLAGVEGKKLPRLRTIQVTRPGKRSFPDDIFPDEEKDCANLGITLQVVIREKPIFRSMDREHHG